MPFANMHAHPEYPIPNEDFESFSSLIQAIYSSLDINAGGGRQKHYPHSFDVVTGREVSVGFDPIPGSAVLSVWFEDDTGSTSIIVRDDAGTAEEPHMTAAMATMRDANGLMTEHGNSLSAAEFVLVADAVHKCFEAKAFEKNERKLSIY